VSYTVVSWHTPDYAGAAAKLERSLDALNIPHVAYECDRLGNWYDTVCHWKPRIVQRALAEYPDSDIVYTDSDSVFHSTPLLFEAWDSAYDIGVHYLRDIELLGGTQYYSNTPKVRKLVDALLSRMDARHLTSQMALVELLRECENVNVYRLPPEYCFIFDISRVYYPTVKPIVEHFQHSRQARLR